MFRRRSKLIYIIFQSDIKFKTIPVIENSCKYWVFNHGDIGPKINNKNHIKEIPNILNASQGNQNIIRIELNRLDELGDNLGNDKGDLNMENNLEFE